MCQRMKHLASLTAAAVLTASVLFTGCASTKSPMSRIDENRDEYEKWPIDVKQAVLDGRVEKGMTPRQVEVAIGKPAKVEIKEGRKGVQEVWIYKKGGAGNVMKGSTVSVGTYGIGVNTAPIGAGIYDEEYEVVFEDDAVVSSDVPATQ